MLNVSCSNIGFLQVVLFLKQLINLVFILVPIGLILMMAIDMFKGFTSGQSDEVLKYFKLSVMRIIYAIVVFFVPTIVKFTFNYFGDYFGDNTLLEKINGCWTNVTAATIVNQINSDKSICNAVSDAKWDDNSNKCIINFKPVSISSIPIKTLRVSAGINGSGDDSTTDSGGDNNNTNGKFKDFKQGDSKWATHLYCTGVHTMKRSGCGATSLSVVLSGLGNDSKVNPEKVRKYICKHGGQEYTTYNSTTYLNKGNTLLKKYGVAGSKTDISYGAYGPSSKNYKSYNSAVGDKMLNKMKKGYALIVLIPHHYVVMTQTDKCSGNKARLFNVGSSASNLNGCMTMKEIWKATYNWSNRCSKGDACGWKDVWQYKSE